MSDSRINSVAVNAFHFTGPVKSAVVNNIAGSNASPKRRVFSSQRSAFPMVLERTITIRRERVHSRSQVHQISPRTPEHTGAQRRRTCLSSCPWCIFADAAVRGTKTKTNRGRRRQTKANVRRCSLAPRSTHSPLTTPFREGPDAGPAAATQGELP